MRLDEIMSTQDEINLENVIELMKDNIDFNDEELDIMADEQFERFQELTILLDDNFKKEKYGLRITKFKY